MRRAIFLTMCAVLAIRFSPHATTRAAEPGLDREVLLDVSVLHVQREAKQRAAAQLSGPSAQVADRLSELEAQGLVSVTKRLRLMTLEGRKAAIQIRHIVPVETGRRVTNRGVEANFEKRDVGTVLAGATQVVGAAIDVELELEISALNLDPGSDSDRSDAGVAPPRTESFSLQISARIPNGHTVVASAIEEYTRDAASIQLVLVAASAAPPPPSVAAAETPAAESQALKVFTLANGKADEMIGVLGTIFAGADGKRIRVSADSRTNSLIVSSDDEAELAMVEALLLRLDERARSRPIIHPRRVMPTRRTAMLRPTKPCQRIGRKSPSCKKISGDSNKSTWSQKWNTSS